MRTWRTWILSFLIVAIPVAASAQDFTFGVGGFAPAFLGVPVPPAGTFPPDSGLHTGVTFTSMLRTVSASVRFPLSRRVWLEGDWTRASGSGQVSFEHLNYAPPPPAFPRPFASRTLTTAAESRTTHLLSANLLRSVGERRVSTFFGVGAAIRRTDAALDYTVRCEPILPNGCASHVADTQLRFDAPKVGVTAQLLMGIDAAMTDRASLLWTVRMLHLGGTSYDDEQKGGFAIDARLRVRGTPRARSSEPPHNFRDAVLTGFVAGTLVGVVAGSRFSEEGRLILPLYSMGIGTGVGALIGALGR